MFSLTLKGQRFPLSTYGETAFILIQNFIILFLVFAYGKKIGLGGAVIAALGAALYALFSRDIVSFSNLATLQAITIPITVASKVPQIVQNYQNKSTGQLSAFTVFNYLGGSLARLFTTQVEVKDPLISTSFALATVLNAVLALQMVWYTARKQGVREEGLGKNSAVSAAKKKQTKK